MKEVDKKVAVTGVLTFVAIALLGALLGCAKNETTVTTEAAAVAVAPPAEPTACPAPPEPVQFNFACGPILSTVPDAAHCSCKIKHGKAILTCRE